MLWDIFCRVIDNYGDIGVSWRLSADLAARGHGVRLWVDDSSALQWMAPGALQGQWPGVQVLPWEQSSNTTRLAALPPADVWIEAFGCDMPQAFVAHFAQQLARYTAADPAQPGSLAKPPVWLNLEYLSAEDYVQRCHGLPSPVMQGPARGWTKFFFYPGFTAHTGGLLRAAVCTPAPPAQDDAQTHSAFLAALGITRPMPSQGDAAKPILVSLFCYEPPLLQALLAQLAASSTPVQLLVTAGRAATAVRQALQEQTERGALQIGYLPALSQDGFDTLLRGCDINFVRGEDSLVRAIWAGKPFVWHIYPQEDLAHAAKLEAFLQQMQLGDAVRTLHRLWNGLEQPALQASALLPLDDVALAQWRTEVQTARSHLRTLQDLGSQLNDFVLKNR